MSFRLANQKWGDRTLGTESGKVTWALDLSGLDKNGYSGKEFKAAVKTAFDDWEKSASVDFAKISNFSAADITISMKGLSGSTVGQATTTYLDFASGIDTIIASEIELDGSAREWAPFGDTKGGLSFYSVALHEIGHAIGLEHVNDETEIMNPFVSVNELGDGDVNGARKLYGSDPGDVPGSRNPEEVPTEPDGRGGEPTAEAADDGGGGGGAVGLIALLIGAILALLGGLVGAGGPAVSMAVGLSRSGAGDDETAADDDADPAPKDAPETPTPLDDLLAQFDDDADLADIIPVLEEAGFRVESHSHDYYDAPDCDGCCGGTCGDPDHIDAALAQIA